MSEIKTHDDYIAQSTEHLQSSLEKLREQLRKIMPDAEEIVNYNMPGFNVGNATIVGYGAFSKQCGIYLHPDAITENSEELDKAGFQPSKTGVKFTPEKPIPEDLLKKLILASRKGLGV